MDTLNDREWNELIVERRARYLRLTVAAAATAARLPIPEARTAYLWLARALKEQADSFVPSISSASRLIKSISAWKTTIAFQRHAQRV